MASLFILTKLRANVHVLKNHIKHPSSHDAMDLHVSMLCASHALMLLLSMGKMFDMGNFQEGCILKWFSPENELLCLC